MMGARYFKNKFEKKVFIKMPAMANTIMQAFLLFLENHVSKTS